MKTDTARNKENAIKFYKMAYDGEPRKAVELFVGPQYIQHIPLVGDGPEPFIAYFEKWQGSILRKALNLSGRWLRIAW